MVGAALSRPLPLLLTFLHSCPSVLCATPETQPVPNPLSAYLHALPRWAHAVSTMGNHFVELLSPFMLLMSRRWRVAGGCVQIAFQLIIIASGNLSFLNHLTILPCILCLDDAAVAWMFSGIDATRAAAAQRGGKPHKPAERGVAELDPPQGLQPSTDVIYTHTTVATRTWRQRASAATHALVDVVFVVLIAYLSIPVVENLLSSNQVRLVLCSVCRVFSVTWRVIAASADCCRRCSR